ncbi:MFS transporter [Saccharopolyspora sp. MS10]|uniref:MFS transporter n=1 Tax=Saccharopolyspora sp. MS10 TaxID=3385973 RepID=UPI0039A0983E
MDAHRPVPAAFLTAMVVDTVGTGVWVTFALLYFSEGRGLPLAATGAALSAGAVAALLLGGLAAGALADRLGAHRAAALGCAVRALAFPAYLGAAHPVAVGLVAFAVSLGERFFWAAHGGLVASATSDDQGRRRMFALLNGLRTLGLGVGALAVAVGAALSERVGPAFWTAIPLLNAAVFALVGLLFHRLGRRCPPAPPPPRSGGYRGVLANRRFLAFTGTTSALTLASVAFDSILPLYLRWLSLPLWLPPMTYVLACALVPAFQPVALRWSGQRAPLRVMAQSAALLAVALGGLALLARCGPGTAVPLLGAVVVLFALGQALFGAVALVVVLGFAGGSELGRYGAAYQLVWGVATAIGPGVHTALFGISGAAPWLVLAIALLGAATVYTRLDRSGRSAVPGRPERLVSGRRVGGGR